MTNVEPLSPEKLYRRCEAAQFQFTTTADLLDGHEIIGQERAIAAIQFGIGIQHEGFHLFALGPNGTGKYTAVNQYLSHIATTKAVPDDWCYIYNFDQPRSPRVLRLPAGQAVILRADMEKLIEELYAVLPAAFTSEEYQAQRKVLEEGFKSHQTRALEALRQQAKELNISLIQTPGGFAFAPIKDGEVVSPDEFLRFSSEEQQKVEKDVLDLQDTLQHIMREVPQWQREAQQKLKELNLAVADFAIAPLFEELKQKFAALPDVLTYLAAVRIDVTENTSTFLDQKDEQSMPSSMGTVYTQPHEGELRYQINVVVNNAELNGAPIIYEDLPRYQNLVGGVEYVSQMGALLTDFTLIKPGALHRANGGYLVLDARKLLQEPYAWEGLKHALRGGTIKIESLGQAYSLISTVSLEPEPIPLEVKVVLVGERQLYYLLCQYEPDFKELFKVAADFADDMPRNEVNNLAYAYLIASLVRKESLRHLERTAVARIVEQSSRLAGDGSKLSIHMQTMSDLMREADYWAGNAGHELVAVDDVQKAIDSQMQRNNRVQEKLQEAMLREVVLVASSGTAVGQINGLAVYALGQHAFGKPCRISARVRMGKGEVIDIERQVEMGGPLHSKGVLILGGFLGARYAADGPFPLSASLVFEQSYGGVDGDSASSAELYALMSALADLSLKQSLAVTGSVNQHGQIQAIGGVNEKIEGFFDLCQARGLTGEQGVLIPLANVQNLMLRHDVVAAVEAGQFAVYPVAHVDQGIEILSGRPVGELDAEGNYEQDSVNGRIVARLTSWADKQRQQNAAKQLND